MREFLPTILQQSGMVVVIIAGLYFAWTRIWPRIEKSQQEHQAAARADQATFQAALTAQQAKYEAILLEQIQDGRARGKARDEKFLAALEQHNQNHVNALAAQTACLESHTQSVTALSASVEALAAKVKPPRRAPVKRKRLTV